MDYGALQDLFGEPVTTSATGTPQLASDVAVNMTIITADEIRHSGTRSIPQIVGMYVPGIDVLQSSSTTYDVGVRGYQQPYQPRLLVLVDGRQVFIDDYSRTVWDNIPVNVDDIRQIEVVKGAASALFGSNAAGGVINIITYSPIYDNDNSVSVSGGTQSALSADATATVKKQDLGGIKVSAGGMNADEFSTSRPAIDVNLFNPMHRYITESSVAQLTPHLQASTEATFSQSKDVGADLLNSFSSQIATTYSVRGGFAWQSPYGLITNNNYLNHTRMQLDFPTFASTPADSTNLIVSQLQDQFKLGSDHTFRIALEYKHKTFNMDTTSTPLAQDAQTDEDGYAVGGTWLWQITPHLAWTNAARLDHQDQAQTGLINPADFVSYASYSHALNAFSANSGLTYEATDDDTFRLSYGRGVQIPSLVQVGYITSVATGAGTATANIGNPELKPTIVSDYEFDYDRKIPDIYSTLKSSIFYEMNQDLTAINPVFGTQVVSGTTYTLIQETNVGNSQGWGGELELKGNHPSGFHWDASWSYSRVYDDSSLESATLDYADSAPRNHLRLLGGYTTGPWEFDANSQYVTSTNMLTSSGASFTDGYFSLGGRIGYAVNDHVTLALTGTNVQSRQLAESPYPAIERQIFLTLTGKF